MKLCDFPSTLRGLDGLGIVTAPATQVEFQNLVASGALVWNFSGVEGYPPMWWTIDERGANPLEGFNPDTLPAGDPALSTVPIYATAYHNAPPAPNNLGAGLTTPLVARNPLTGADENMVATTGEDGDQRFYFTSDGPIPPREIVSLAYAGGYSVDNSGGFAAKITGAVDRAAAVVDPVFNAVGDVADPFFFNGNAGKLLLAVAGAATAAGGAGAFAADAAGGAGEALALESGAVDLGTEVAVDAGAYAADAATAGELVTDATAADAFVGDIPLATDAAAGEAEFAYTSAAPAFSAESAGVELATDANAAGDAVAAADAAAAPELTATAADAFVGDIPLATDAAAADFVGDIPLATDAAATIPGGVTSTAPSWYSLPTWLQRPVDQIAAGVENAATKRITSELTGAITGSRALTPTTTTAAAADRARLAQAALQQRAGVMTGGGGGALAPVTAALKRAQDLANQNPGYTIAGALLLAAVVVGNKKPRRRNRSRSRT